MKKLLLFIFLSALLLAESFSTSKRLLSKDIYFDNKNTFYCEVPYEAKLMKGKYRDMILKTDKYIPRNPYTKKGKFNWRTKRIEWEHVMPAHNFGRHMSCWKEGGRKLCKKDKTFNIMEGDMHNLVPAIGELNGDRLNYKFSALPPKVGMYGSCEFSVNFKERRAFVKNDIKGDIARIYFYMSDRYKIRLSDKEKKMFQAWSNLDPVSDWEIEKNIRVFKIQGNSNKYIENLETGR